MFLTFSRIFAWTSSYDCWQEVFFLCPYFTGNWKKTYSLILSKTPTFSKIQILGIRTRRKIFFEGALWFKKKTSTLNTKSSRWSSTMTYSELIPCFRWRFDRKKYGCHFEWYIAFHVSFKARINRGRSWNWTTFALGTAAVTHINWLKYQ